MFLKKNVIILGKPASARTILKYFAKLKNVAHSLEPGETPSNSASHQAPNYIHHSKILQNMMK